MKQLEFAAETEELTVAYEEKPVLWNVNCKIPKGQLTAIIGPNGAGKTTLMKAMLGLIRPVSGAVRFFGTERQRGQIRDARIGYVPQSESVDWDFPATVLDIVLMGCYGRIGWLRRPQKKDKIFAKQMLAKVGMTGLEHRQISQLSGGQQQRVFLARALMQEAEIYFMDEPFKGVDIQTEKAIIALLKELKTQGKTVVVVHHDLQTVPEYFDWVTLINCHLIASGNVTDVFTEENLQKTYKSRHPLSGKEQTNRDESIL